MSEENYDFPPFRPPSEADSLLLRVTRGCPWNRCAFCPMYKHIKFEKRPVQAVKQDIDTAKVYTGGNVETVFIADSDSLVINTGEMCQILGHLHAVFPSLTRVTTYGRALTLKRKSLDSLKKIRKAGLTRLHIGLETGSPQLLDRIKKGAGPETMIHGCNKAKEAGFEVSLYVLLGIGGESSWQEHALETAKVLNQINPDFIRVRTLTPQPNTPVFQWWREGSFQIAGPETILKEQKTLIEGLSVTSQYLSDHVSNYAPVDGNLPADKTRMLSLIDTALEKLSKDVAFRTELEGMRYLRRL
ncbi:MAG: radical SAM protein [Deltaproteobacteria bacterium]|nr:radical SAM protein [Deltaproteobacteria bacterium]MBW2018896.1 radical SAM protein [Deltaproteobacteria bacterium]MBW2073651.1 radical SAM protein [Deltaproteobacteria bacterium]